ncbi:OmpA family protein [Anaeromyxobacter oryzae]|nr:OmpA family protein [Anaeromyxobacter oryzae]
MVKGVGKLRTLALASALAAGIARADSPAARGFDPDPARLALSVDGGFVVETAAAAPEGSKGAALVLDYAEGLLALRLGSETDQLVQSRLTANVLASWSFGRLEVGVHLPIAMHQGSDLSLLTRQGVTGPLADPVAATALGDLRVGAKLPLLEEGPMPVGLAALLELRAPTGDKQAFTSDGAMAVPGVVATRHLGAWRLDGQLGYAIRAPGQYAQLVVHDGLVYGVGASVELPPLSAVKRWKAILELSGGLPRGDNAQTERYRAPLSALGGVRAWLWRGLAVEAGGGTGIGDAGYGRESWRVFAGVRWSEGEVVGPPDADWDRDGVPNAQDLCPRQPGTPELDGCQDRDGDGIPDPQDKCPDEPGPAENNGCPVKDDEPLVEIQTEHLSLKDSIHFDTGLDTIKPESSRILDAIAALLNQHPELKRIQVEGHTDNVGARTYNQDLSQRRAQSVVRALVQRSVTKERLGARGYGFEKPIADNGTALGRAKNRRVEFTILSEQ